ncbi:hypothetical protein J7M23_08805 [Candidatus Sumerlaeota bacterium]|nr:hypothetical protein [Candidatus Sumerlaeota bacterium]
MKKAFCVNCGKPAKRLCPLKDNRPICSLCCSEQVQDPHTPCPEDCPYWRETVAYLEDKLIEKMRRLVRAEPSAYFHNLGDQELLVFFVMFKMFHYVLKENDFTDTDLLSALGSLRNELIASRSKLIYESTPMSPTTSHLFTRMRDYLIIKPPENEPSESLEPKEFILNQFAPASVDAVFNLLERLIRRHHTSDQKGFIQFFRKL